jgi:AcrR family transcriptional regulator
LPSANSARRPRQDEGADEPHAFRRRPRQPRGQRRVDLLLDAAASVIAEQGLHAATAEAIAQRAHTAKGSLYQFFPNRDAVLAALALRYAGELETVYDESFAGKPHSLSLPRLIDRIVAPLAAFHDRNPAFRRVFAALDAPTLVTGSGATPAGASPRIRAQLFDSFVDRLESLFAARNPSLPARDRRRGALVAAAIGQALLARRDHAPAADKKPLLDELRRALAAYVGPLLDAPTRSRRSATPRPTLRGSAQKARTTTTPRRRK